MTFSYAGIVYEAKARARRFETYEAAKIELCPDNEVIEPRVDGCGGF